jgi:hypothetical protein
MYDFKEKISRNPLKYFVLTLVGIALILSISLIFTSYVCYNPTIIFVSSFFNQTNVSTTANFFITETTSNYSKIEANCSINNSNQYQNFPFELISSIIAILGAFSVLTYFFYSIKEGTLSKIENKKIIYGFEGGMGLAIILTGIVLISSLHGMLSFEKNIEILSVLIFLVITTAIAAFFLKVMDEFEESHSNRVVLNEFLEIKDYQEIIWQPLDNLARYIVKDKENFSMGVFVLILVVPIFGVIRGLNLLSIVVVEIMIFALFSGFCRLTNLCENSSDILLNRQFYSEQFSFESKKLSKIFILPSQEESYFKILTNGGYLTISKSEVITIHDNEVIIFKGKDKLFPLNIWIKRSFRFVISVILAPFFYWIIFFVTLGIAILFQIKVLLEISLPSMSLLILAMQGMACVFAFCLIGWFSKKIDEWLASIVDQYIVSPKEFDSF